MSTLPPPPSYNEATTTYDGNTLPQSGGYHNPPPVGYGTQSGYSTQTGYDVQPGAYPPSEGIGYTAPPYGSEPPHHSSQTTFANQKYDSEIGAEEDAVGAIISFDSKSVRLGFIRKVFTVLALQMMMTTAFIVWFLFHEPTRVFVQSSLPTYIAAYVLFIVLYIVLACCKAPARKHPLNLILLALFTVSLSYMAAAISSFHSTGIVLVLFGSTCIISLAIMLFACQTKFDFTKCGGVLFVGCIALFCFGLFAGIMVPTGQMEIVRVVYGSLGALLFMAFLAFDVQLVMGGRKHEISPEDYVFASLMLYIDIIYIFLFLLQIFGNN